ncbi:bifunctional metallophosphatase/5'-nucleotidase [Corynebacterium camporealensis]
MKLRRLGQFVAATIVTAMATAGLPAIAQEGNGNTVTFSVSNITDFHGHLENGLTSAEEGGPEAGDEMGAALLQALIQSVNEGQEYNLTTSGDNVGGSAYISAISEDKYTLEALNAMGVVASAVGNHEFDKGTEDLTDRITDASNYPILGANVLQNGQPLLEASHVEKIDGVKVGYVGTVTENTEAKVAPALIPGVEFTDPVAATNEEAKRLKESGEADVVVALMHEDAAAFADDMSNDVDVLFGGDTHQKTKGEVAREGAQPLQWAQGHEYGKLLNDVDITFDKDAGEITDIELTQYDATHAAELTEDAELAEIVAQAAEEAAVAGQEVVGTMGQALFRGSDEGKESGSNRGVESTLNNFIADGQRYSMAKATDRTIDIAVMNAGGVRADLPAGEVTYEDIFTVQPFGNSVAYGTISGADFIQALENQWQPGNSRPRLALGLSNNVQVVYDQEAEDGNRIQSVTVNGEQLDPEQDYTIALSTFLIGAGDGYFAEGVIKDVQDVGYMDTQAMIDYIASGESEVRTGQAQIGVNVDGEFAEGETVTLNLSSLNYTTEGEPLAETVTVKLGDEEVTADIDNTAKPEDAQFGERGRATVELTVPENLPEDAQLEITTDAGTEAVLPIEVASTGGGNDDDDDDNGSSNGSSGSSEGSSGSSNGSSAAGIALGISASIALAIAGIIGALGMNPQFLPAPVRKIFEDFLKQLPF